MDSDTLEVNFKDGRLSRLRIDTGWLAGAVANSAPLPVGVGLAHRCLVVSDQQTASHADRLARRLEQTGREMHRFSLPAGEPAKSDAWLIQLWQQLAALGFDRSSCLIAVGGGVVGDLAGFAAATFMRGIPWFVVPTTLVAQVDSAIGGKVGINLPAGKNLVGAFWQPLEVWIDPELLSTLPEREYLSGLAEVIKYGVIADIGLFELLERETTAVLERSPAILRKMIWRCCQIKAKIVSLDERETLGLRSKLNYGHTFGHGIEKVAGYGQFLHGEAVAIGMTWAAQTAQRLGLAPTSLVARQLRLIKRCGLPTDWPAAPGSSILEAMKLDKKRSGGLPQLILPREIGLVESSNWPGDNLILSVIEEAN